MQAATRGIMVPHNDVASNLGIGTVMAVVSVKTGLEGLDLASVTALIIAVGVVVNAYTGYKRQRLTEWRERRQARADDRDGRRSTGSDREVFGDSDDDTPAARPVPNPAHDPRHDGDMTKGVIPGV